MDTPLDELMAAAGLGFLTRRATSLARPSLRFHLERVAPEDVALGTTRVGGDPDVPEGFEWPHMQGVALPFVAQINLGDVAALSALPDLPPSGMLYFFFGEDAYFASADSRATSWQVTYQPDDSVPLQRMPAPDSVPLRERYQPCRVHMAAEVTLPPLDPYDDDSLARLGLAERLSDEQQAAYWHIQQELAARVRPKHHFPINRLRGWADAVQWEVERECLAEVREAELMDGASETHDILDNPWRLLFQIDTDGAPDTDWGDTGRVYFLIRQADLIRRDFSTTCAILQCT